MKQIRKKGKLMGDGVIMRKRMQNETLAVGRNKGIEKKKRSMKQIGKDRKRDKGDGVKIMTQRKQNEMKRQEKREKRSSGVKLRGKLRRRKTRWNEKNYADREREKKKTK